RGDAGPLPIGGRTDLVPATAQNKHAAERLVQALRPEGGTDHLPALPRALVLQPDVIFFLTDDEDLPEALVQTITRLNHGHTAIHTMEANAMRRGAGLMGLALLAGENRGTYRPLTLNH